MHVYVWVGGWGVAVPLTFHWARVEVDIPRSRPGTQEYETATADNASTTDQVTCTHTQYEQPMNHSSLQTWMTLCVYETGSPPSSAALHPGVVCTPVFKSVVGMRLNVTTYIDLAWTRFSLPF